MTASEARYSATETGSTMAPANPRLVTTLKFAVVGMAILIVLGMGAVIWRIVGLAKDSSLKTAGTEKSAITGTASTSAGLSSALVPEAILNLPAGAAVRSTSLSGNRLAVHFDAPSGSGIAIIDLESGQTLTRVHLPPAN